MISTMPEHIRRIVNTGKSITTSSGEDIEIFELNHENDEEVLSIWANHFREHYCLNVY